MTNRIDDETRKTVETLAAALEGRGLRLAVAESCTGGLIAAWLTSLPGASDWFEAGLVTYRLSAKTALLGVSADYLATHGAVNRTVAEAMARGTLDRTGADVSVATTGLAGPEGDGTSVPVGTLWIAWAFRAVGGAVDVDAHEFRLAPMRDTFRREAAAAALEGLLERLQKLPA